MKLHDLTIRDLAGVRLLWLHGEGVRRHVETGSADATAREAARLRPPLGPMPNFATLALEADARLVLHRWYDFAGEQARAALPWSGTDATASMLVHVFACGFTCGEVEGVATAPPRPLDFAGLHRLWDELPPWHRKEWAPFARRIDDAMLDLFTAPHLADESPTRVPTYNPPRRAISHR